VNVEKVIVNGMVYLSSRGDFEKIDVLNPTQEEPYWQIDFLVKGKMVKRILATGQVTIIREEV